MSETVREALARLAHVRASQRLLALRGKVQFDMTWEEMRGKDDEEATRGEPARHGPPSP